MDLVPWTTISAAIAGEDLVVTIARGGITGVRRSEPVVLHDALKTPAPDDLRSAPALTGGGRLVLVVPGDWCFVRPAPMDCRSFDRGREELARSVSMLLPLTGDEAFIGFVEGAPGEDGNSRGWIIAAERARIEPWVEAVRRIFGRAPDEVVSAHAALAGLGLNGQDAAEVVESGTGARSSRHVLAFGRVVELNGVRSTSETIAAGPVETAVGAALAGRLAPGSYSPLMGKSRPRMARWATPAILGAAAAAVVAAAVITDGVILRRGITRLEESAEAQRDEAEHARRVRDEAVTLAGRMRTIDSLRARWESVLPALAAAQAAVPGDGFLYRVEIDGGQVTLRGEASRASDVLRNLDQSPFMTSPRQIEAATGVPERDSEQFFLRAQRREIAKAATAGEGAP